MTQDDFEPNQVSSLGSTPDADVRDAADAMPPTAATASICTDPDGCCALPGDCPDGETCLNGACVGACSAEDVSTCAVALAPSCSDGAQNGREPAVDCGEGCPDPCGTDSACYGDLDCASGRCSGSRCAAATCDDDTRNQDESGIDCGGPCGACGAGEPCRADEDCENGSFCAPSTRLCTDGSCQDGVQSGNERRIDCGGGECPGCPPGSPCSSSVDCESRACRNGSCEAASCDDGVSSGEESGVDCGGSSECPRCDDEQRCRSGDDCVSGACGDGLCISCSDGAQNGSETGADCGGGNPECARCPEGVGCAIGGDCASGRCSGGLCEGTSCDDGAQNGTETDIDCGGGDLVCVRCEAGDSCSVDTDCASGACENGSCCGGSQADCTRCAERLSPSIDCNLPVQGVDSTGMATCAAFLGCLSANRARCPTRNAPGCSGDDQASDACPHNDYGGNAGTGISRANQVLVNAGCQL